MAPVELEVVVHKQTADTKCGFILESDYEGDNGHPRIRDVEPSSIANGLLFKGDILMAINGTAIAHHNQAAKVLKGCKGDMVLTVLAKKPRSTSFFGKKSKSSLASSSEKVSAVKAAAAEQTAAEVAAAAKAAADKAAAIAADAATKVQNVGDGVKDFFNGAAAKVQGISPGRKSKSDVAKDENEGLETANEAGEQKAVNGGKIVGMIKRASSALVEPFTLCAATRKSSLSTSGGLPPPVKA